MSLLCLVCATLPLLAASPAPSEFAPPKLSVRSPGGASFHELTREPEFSLAELVPGRAGVAQADQLALRGACAVLQDRAEAHVLIERISMRPALFRLSFPKQPDAELLQGPAKSAFSALECVQLARN